MPVTKWSVEEVLRKGVQLSDLVTTYRADLAPRLDANVIEGFLSDLPALRDEVSRVSGAHLEKAGETIRQDDVAREAARTAITFREAVKSTFSRKSPVRAAFGIGGRIDETKVGSVATALAVLVHAAEEDPVSARAAGILSSDLADLKAVYDKLVQADRTQELAKGSAKGATATRTARHVRVEAAMTRIVGVSGIVFRKRPEIAQRFADCLPRTARPRKKKA
ncbi:MAG TPA: hypothetical protein DFS52_09080 [Myxococcales bacterium]|jgi:hypothetical protein|nr:hypothetical protein [Myxococcales bacterium]